MIARPVYLFALGLTAAPALAQPKPKPNTLALAPDAAPGKATLADVGWLAGHWVGPGLGGICEEVWVPPLAGSAEMMGMFRLVKDGKTQFTEHFVLTEDGPSLTLKLKHFDPAFTAREEKDRHTTFRFIRAEPDALYFDRLTFRKTADGGLDVFVAIKRDGKDVEAPFRFKPAKR